MFSEVLGREYGEHLTFARARSATVYRPLHDDAPEAVGLFKCDIQDGALQDIHLHYGMSVQYSG